MRAEDVRDAVLAAATKDFTSRAEVDGLYVSGSLAQGNADEFSDIDLRVVVFDAAYQSLLTLRDQLPIAWVQLRDAHSAR